MADAPKARVALIILDGFGLSAYEKGNAVTEAKHPYLDSLLTKYPSVALRASGTDVGLEWGEVGNSEVGHFNIGAGRVVLQDLPRINAAIESKRFFENATLIEAAKLAKSGSTTLHVIGLASDGGVHGHIDHIKAVLEFAKDQSIPRIVVHAITDGRDTQPKVAEGFVKDLVDTMQKLGTGTLGTVVGRYWAMDRDNRWDRIQKAFEAIVDRKGTETADMVAGVTAAYNAGQSDESLEPLVNPEAAGIKDGDVVIMTNYRADRARQLMQALTDPTFTGFKRSTSLEKLEFISFTNYGQEATNRVKVAFFAEPLSNYLAQIISKAKLPQLHAAETEKYAHVTYFLNAGQEAANAGEDRILVPSPKVASYDTVPIMSAKTVQEEFSKRFTDKYSFGVVNFANPDMVGHTGDLKATITAIEALDGLLKTLINGLLEKGVHVLITADHGNAEQMIHPKTGDVDKEHTVNPVPFILASPDHAAQAPQTFQDLASTDAVGVLADVAPTILELLGLEPSAEMTGQSLVNAI